MASVNERQRALIKWASSQSVFTISAWTREAGVSYPTAKKDFDRIGEAIEPFFMGNQCMGFTLKEVIS